MQVGANVNYHVKKTERQAFEFDVDGIIGKLVSPELVASSVTVTDQRYHDDQLEFHRDGIEFVSAPALDQDLTTCDDWQSSYNRDLIELLKDRVGAKEVIVFDHTVRVDDPEATRRPARNVHIDYNRAAAESRLIDLLGEADARDFHTAGYGFVNVWRPIESLIQSSPLGFIRPDTLDPSDLINIDLIYPDRTGQITGVTANRYHEWFYQSAMTPEEGVIFNLYDNRGLHRIAHSALDLHVDVDPVAPRKSIESRTIVKYS